jgi:hypothetical protein
MRRCLLGIIVGLIALPGASDAWWGGGHDLITLAAVRATPDDVPAFFREGERGVAHAVYDPDILKNRGVPLARGTEHGEHYLDKELLEGRPLPRTRYEFIQLCHELGAKPEKVGTVVYAVSEWTERLTVAFAEHRKWPDNPYVKSKCLIYAGILAHYSEDMCQPLHLTVHFDGKKQKDGTKPLKGIHEKIDAFPETFKMDPDKMAKGLKVVPIDSLMIEVIAQFERGFKLVDTAYALGDRFPKYGQKDWKKDDEVIAFANERTRESARFTASLFVTAWHNSSSIKLDGWLDRNKDMKDEK